MGKQHEKIAMQNEMLEEKMEEGLEKRCVGCVVRKMDEQVEELKENLEEHVQDDGAHQIKEQLEQLKESLEEHVEDEVAHHFEEQLEKLEEKVEKKHEKLEEKMKKQHDKLKDKMEDDKGSSSSEEEDGWLRGKMSGLFGSRTHFGSAHPRQVDSGNVDSNNVAENLHQAHRLGGHWAAAHALWWLEEGSSAHGVHFNQGAVAFQALPREVKENLMRRAILIMHNDLLVSQAVAELHKKKST